VIFQKACELGLEGIVSKQQGSFYKSGPSRNWLKTKNPNFERT
jgi:bifunctional non-homologous end joining protein LigD